jgi:hypothetical protein
LAAEPFPKLLNIQALEKKGDQTEETIGIKIALVINRFYFVFGKEVRNNDDSGP